MKRAIVVALILSPLFLSGCFLNDILSDVVSKAPTAVIDAAPSNGSAPLDVTFDAGYSHDDDGGIVEYRWDFGDPMSTGTQIGASAQHTYDHPGTYLVKLTVIDDAGLIDSQQIAVVVTNSVPVAVASVSNENPLPGNRVTFNASASYDLQGAIASYDWDFGDGSTASGVSVEHTYVEGKYYVVTLTVTDGQGATARTHLGMNVQPGQSRCGGDDNSSCGSGGYVLAVITGLPSSCTNPARVGEPVRLDGSFSRSEDAEIRFYHWDFGDGTTGSGPIVTHTFDRAWTYTVRLTVTDEYGNSNSCSVGCPVGPGSCT